MSEQRPNEHSNDLEGAGHGCECLCDDPYSCHYATHGPNAPDGQCDCLCHQWRRKHILRPERGYGGQEMLTKDQKRSRLPHEYLGPPFPQIYLLKCAVYAAWKSNLIGGPQASHDRFEWFKRLEPGHLIMETTTAWDNRRDEERFGYLVSNAMEPCHSDEEWLELLKAGDYDEEQDKRPMERIYRIKLLTDGRDFRWENADFIRVPTDLRDFP